MKNTLAIRFKNNGIGFPDWKAYFLSEILKPKGKRNIHGHFGREDVLSVTGERGVVNQIEHLGRSFAGESLESYRVVDTGDIVYTKSPLKNAPFGIIKTNKGKSGIVSTLYAVYVCNEREYANLLEEYFSSSVRLNNYLRPLVNIGAKNDMKINDQRFLNGKVVLPTPQEASQLVNFFTCLNKKIALVERKLNAIKDLNKSLIHSLITCKNCPWKSDGWETVELGHIVNFQKERSSSSFYVGTEDLKSDFSGVNKVEREYQEGISFSNGNLLLGNIRPYLRKLWLADSEGVCSPDVLVFCANGCDPFYLKTILSSDHFFEYIAKGYKGSKMPRGDKKQILKYELKLPSTIEEQKEISTIFKNLDQKIIYCKMQIDTLKMLKQSLLQQMFV